MSAKDREHIYHDLLRVMSLLSVVETALEEERIDECWVVKEAREIVRNLTGVISP